MRAAFLPVAFVFPPRGGGRLRRDRLRGGFLRTAGKRLVIELEQRAAARP